MSTIINTEATANGDGGVDLHLPGATEPFARVALRVEVAEVVKPPGRFSKRFASKADYQAAMDRIFGSCDDPTFVLPEDQPVQDVEPL